MVNWTTRSQNLEGTWKFDDKFDLPVPQSGYECAELIYETEEFKSLFTSGDDGLADEYEEVTATALNILSQIHPRDLSTDQLDHDSELEIKMWLFKYEILCSLQDGTTNTSSYYENICDVYLERLKERYEQLVKEPWHE